MELEAKGQGYYAKESFDNTYDKIQILTIEDLLNGQNVKIPQHLSKKGVFKTEEKFKVVKKSEKIKMF